MTHTESVIRDLDPENQHAPHLLHDVVVRKVDEDGGRDGDRERPEPRARVRLHGFTGAGGGGEGEGEGKR